MTDNSAWATYQKRSPIVVVQGEYEVSKDHEAYMSVVLGSCVSVCLFDSENQVGGMNHILLPGTSALEAGPTRHGVHLMELLINGILRLGGEKVLLQAKIFGGAKVSRTATDIGAKNARFVKEFLQNEQIPCVSESLGGSSARKVQFVPTSGMARQMLVEGPKDLFEKEIQQTAREATVDTDITLF